MPHVQFCSNCRAENLLDAAVCERCGTPLSETEPNSFDQKLILALHQPIPETRDMAAILLAQRRKSACAPGLAVTSASKRPTSVCSAPSARLWHNLETVEAVCITCQTPGATTCTRGGTRPLSMPWQRSPRWGCWEALDVLKAPPPVTERVAKEIAVKLATLNLLYY